MFIHRLFSCCWAKENNDREVEQALLLAFNEKIQISDLYATSESDVKLHELQPPVEVTEMTPAIKGLKPKDKQRK